MKLGFYRVNNQIYTDKIQAILEANKTLADITWHFNEEVFSNINWTQEPVLDVDSYYKVRCQQLREQFDYLIVMVSGGADSTNVVWSFLNNNIIIDEIVAAAPLSGLRNYSMKDNDVSTSNTISETMYAQIPLLQEIATFYPYIKITLNDYFKDMVNYKTDDWLYNSADWIHPTTTARYSLEKYSHLKNLAESGKRIGIIYGIDKPLPIIGRDGNIYQTFSDSTVNVQRPAFNLSYPNVENVLFYHTPELPEMIVKQLHLVCKWFFNPINKNKLKFFNDRRKMSDWTFEQHRKRHSIFERIIIPLIYPTTVKPVFQGMKPTRMFLADHDDWFYDLHKNSKPYQMIISDFNNFYKNIDKKYLNTSRTGFDIYVNYYQIGPVNQFIGAAN
jgi:hypothetical protein